MRSVWFLLGYLAYALMFAAVGALVSRQEDVGGRRRAADGADHPPVRPRHLHPARATRTASLLGVLSLIPLFSPDPDADAYRGRNPGWETGVAIALTLALIAALVWLAGRIYGNAVTRTGARVKLRDALKPI